MPPPQRQQGAHGVPTKSGNAVDLADLFPSGVVEVRLPDGTSWYRDEIQHCDDDTGLRPYNEYCDLWVACDGCGEDLFTQTP